MRSAAWRTRECEYAARVRVRVRAHAPGRRRRWDVARVAPAVNHLHDQVALTFGGFDVMTRFSQYVEAQGWGGRGLTAIAYEDDERLDALAGEPRGT